MSSYLLKNRHGNYYTRVPFPHALCQLGYPQEIRLSLLTKDRHEATLRNLVAAHGLKQLIGKLAASPTAIIKPNNDQPITRFRDLLEPDLARLRQRMLALGDALIPSSHDPDRQMDEPSALIQPNCASPIVLVSAESSSLPVEPRQPRDAGVTLPVTMSQLQAEFIQRKSDEGISPRSVQQLQTRTDALVQAVGAAFFVQALKFKQVDCFMQVLGKGLKEKTVREYKAACAQMLGFAVKLEYTPKNPFDQIKVKRSQPTPRQRWERPQLKALFSSPNFTQHAYDNVDDFWIPLVLLHTGARPAEICQLQVRDVVNRDHIPCLNITDKGEAQSIKTDNSQRLVPIHSKLIALGFLHFVEQRRKQGHTQLFSCKATGEFGEWTKNFEGRFSRYLNRLGFAAGQRPTAYGFRHAIIDELQQLDTPEPVVADLVGHSKKGFTYRHYGKQTPVQRLQEVVEQLDFGDELASVVSAQASRRR
ncbi:site-specific integrase [Aeromonas caviae]|nr:site-specific integrase [Aeromonas caviae]MBL0549790.1 site-specific integrase [Aeromonas caviae]MDX7812548.1 site-specific integrase [Aeromonas caviae]MDX7817052.1 site-specific integrase [Aeromonas caviae]NAZ61781.1 tyrosine-type recombinase/integrase [Aeromonas caviae]